MTRRMTLTRTRGRSRAKKFRRVWNIALVEGAKLAKQHEGMSNSEFRSTLKSIIDRIFVLPPIAEEISDIVISVVVDSVVWRIRESKSDWVLVERGWLKYAKECVEFSEASANKVKAKKKKATSE